MDDVERQRVFGLRYLIMHASSLELISSCKIDFNFKAPEEVWLCKPVEYSMLKIFGYLTKWQSHQQSLSNLCQGGVAPQEKTLKGLFKRSLDEVRRRLSKDIVFHMWA